MSQQDNFGSGFFLGTLFGGVLGGVVGAIVASRLAKEQEAGARDRLLDSENQSLSPAPFDEEMEVARRGLEDKIAQLNSAIDDVRQRFGSANGQSHAPEEVGRDYDN
jgi:gas vesicle protein